MRVLFGSLAATVGLYAQAGVAIAEVAVVASIKPVHSLVAAVMEGVGEPGLVVAGAGSPHAYSLKPSQAAMLENADVIFWVGPQMEAFLEKPIETIGTDARSVKLIDAHGLATLGFREGGAFEEDAHEDHDDEGHKEIAEGDHHDDHGHEETAESDHRDDHGNDEMAEGDHDDHDHAGGVDGHVWLDPENAKAIVREVEEALVALDPDNAAVYKANAAAVTAELDALIAEVDEMLVPVRDNGFVVFHDAYHYFENRFDISAAGSITVSPEVIPGAERITEIQEKVVELGATCVFAEPQFEPKLVSVVVEGTEARSGVLDPLGSELEDGPDLYFTLIRNLAKSMRDCLAEAS